MSKLNELWSCLASLRHFWEVEELRIWANLQEVLQYISHRNDVTCAANRISVTNFSLQISVRLQQGLLMNADFIDRSARPLSTG